MIFWALDIIKICASWKLFRKCDKIIIQLHLKLPFYAGPGKSFWSICNCENNRINFESSVKLIKIIVRPLKMGKNFVFIYFCFPRKIKCHKKLSHWVEWYIFLKPLHSYFEPDLKFPKIVSSVEKNWLEISSNESQRAGSFMLILGRLQKLIYNLF